MALLQENRELRALEAARQKITPAAGVVMITSLISHRNQRPRVDIQVGEVHTQVDAETAIDIARNIMEVAVGAYADAFIFNFLTEKIDMGQAQAAGIVGEFRGYREQLLQEFEKRQEGKSNGPAF